MSPTELQAHIGPPASALAEWPEIRLDTVRADAFRHGQFLEGVASTAGFARVHDAEGALIGVGAVDSARRLRPIRILHADRSDARVLPA